MKSFSSRVIPLLAVVFIPAVTAVACGTSSTKAAPCIAGQQIACACSGGGSGVQVCTAEGTYGACGCGSGDGGTTGGGSDGTTSGDGPCSCGEGGGDSGGDHVTSDAPNDTGLPADSGPLTGSLLWAKQYGTAQGTPTVVGVAADASGNILLTGSFTGTVNFGSGNLTSAGASDIFVVKVNPTGHALWSKSYGGTGDEGGNSVAVDAGGNVVVVGGFDDTLNLGGGPVVATGASYDIFLAKFDGSGSYVWAKAFGDAQLQTGRGVAVDGSGNVFIEGANWGTVNFGGGALTSTGPAGELYLAKFDKTGAASWSRGFQNTGNTPSQAAECWQVVVDAQGSPLLTGAFYGAIDLGGGPLTSAGKRDVFVGKFDATGSLAWANRYGDLQEQEGSGIALDAVGDVVLAGAFNSTLNFGAGAMTSTGNGDLFVAKLDPSGNGVWSKHFGDATSDNVGGGPAVRVDRVGNVLIGGGLYGNADFGGGLLMYVGDFSASDAFVAKFDGAGNYAWAYLGNNLYSDANALATDTSGNVLLAGPFTGPLSFAGASLTAPANTFLVKLAP